MYQGNTDIIVYNISALGEKIDSVIVGDPSFNDEAVRCHCYSSWKYFEWQERPVILECFQEEQEEILTSISLNYSQTLVPFPNWTGRYGFSGVDKAESVTQKANGDFVFLGSTDKEEPDGSEKSQSNMIVFQVTEQGLPNTSDITFGTAEQEFASSLASTSDNGLLLVGSTINGTKHFESVYIKS